MALIRLFDFLLLKMFGPGSASYSLLEHKQRHSDYSSKELPEDYDCCDVDNKRKWLNQFDKITEEK